MRYLLATAIALTFAGTAAAQPPHLVTHNGSLMEVAQDPAGVVRIVYRDPRPSLQAIGVAPGALLVEGRWVAKGQFAGFATVFGCGLAWPYQVTGTVVEGGGLLLEGPAPVITPWCFLAGYTWASDNAHLLFVPFDRRVS